jgi:hypothetical protein
METTSAVYKLSPNSTDPRFQGFIHAPGAKSVLGFEHAYEDFRVDDPWSLDWQPRSLKAVWKPRPVTAPVSAFNDYPCLGLITPAFSSRAVDALGEMLTENGELLPLETDVGEYYAFNCMTKIDALDVDRSRLDRKQVDEVAGMIDYFVFHKDKLDGASIFRIPELPNPHFVTDRFKERVETAHLNGFEFSIVWPLPEDANWRRIAKVEREKQSKKTKLQGHSLVMRFWLQAEQPDDTEKKLADALVKSLLATLKLDSLQDKYHGFLENFEFADGEFRMFCSCPDCEELARHLADWLEQLHWPGEVQMIKRFGTLYDKRVKTKQVTIRKAKG